MTPAIRTFAIIFLIVSLLLWAYSFYRGRKIVEYLRRRHRTKWEESGSPKPEYLNSLGFQKWMKFFSQKQYLDFNDPKVTGMCEYQKKLERLTVITTVLFFVIFGSIAAWDKYAA